MALYNINILSRTTIKDTGILLLNIMIFQIVPPIHIGEWKRTSQNLECRSFRLEACCFTKWSGKWM